jgi:methionyl-tRNA formyltransferase
MKIIIITQNDPFYLAKNLKYLISVLPDHSEIVGCVLADASPFGKKESFIKKVKKTYDVFGFGFFMHYSIKFLKSKIDKTTNVYRFLKDNSIPIITLDSPINEKQSVDRIKAFEPDLLVSILGNQIFKNPIIELAPKGCLNLHTALLPKYRGLMPTFWVMKNNEATTGVSVFNVNKGIDSGPIIVQKEVKIGNKTQEELIILTKKIGMNAIAESVDLIYKNEVQLIENDDSKMSYFSFPTREDVMEFRNNGKKFF